MPTVDDVRRLILTALPGADVVVDDTTGTGDHFRAVVTSRAFAGLGLVDQHRLVYGAVDDQLRDGSIHALSIRTVVADATSTSNGAAP